MKDEIVSEQLGSMTCFESITPQQVEALSNSTMDYDAFCATLDQFGLNAGKVVFDPSRYFLNTFYADYEKGLYGCFSISQTDFARANAEVLSRLRHLNENGNTALLHEDWETYYGIDHEISLDFFSPAETVPLPMRIYDFGRRMRSFPPCSVFPIWLKIYKGIDYSNGMWTSDILEYVFSMAPKASMPDTNEKGVVALYRGAGALSIPPEKAISWSTHAGNALWFANHTGRGTEMLMAEVAPEDIVWWQPGFSKENEVIVLPGKVTNIRSMDMLPATEEAFTSLTVPALLDFVRFGRQASKFGYKEESIFEYHGIMHILRVLLLSLIYYCGAQDGLGPSEKDVMIYFSLLHDAGRIHDDIDDGHGLASVALINKQDLRVSGLHLSRKDYKVAELLIAYHCMDDDVGIAAIHSQTGFSRKDKERAVHLYRICKDMDGLDRVRFNGLDPTMLRTDFAKRLPLIAGCLLKEDLLGALKEGQ